MKKRSAALAIALFLFAAHPPAWAVYKDEIAVSQDEVWKAVLDTFKPLGIRKTDEQKKELETKWITDKVVKSSGLLKRIAKEEYVRRYRFKVRLHDRSGDTAVEIRGIFQQKHANAGSQVSWSLIKPTLEDLDVERDYFMKILATLGRNRSES